MGTLSDRISMTVIVVTGAAGFIAMLLSFFIPYETGWWSHPALIAGIVLLFLALVALVWEGFDAMD